MQHCSTGIHACISFHKGDHGLPGLPGPAGPRGEGIQGPLVCIINPNIRGDRIFHILKIGDHKMERISVLLPGSLRPARLTR